MAAPVVPNQKWRRLGRGASLVTAMLGRHDQLELGRSTFALVASGVPGQGALGLEHVPLLLAWMLAP